MKYYKFLYLIMICLMLLNKVYSAVLNEKLFLFSQFDNRNGLSNSSINTIFQDKNQILWVGTWDGLNRFDGKNFKIYNDNFAENKNGIGSHVIFSIQQDRQQNLWINTVGGISKYNQNTGVFDRYFHNNQIAQRVIENEYKLIIMPKGEVLCFDSEGNLFKYSYDNNKFEILRNNSSGSSITKAELFKNNLLILRSNGLLDVVSLTANGYGTVHSFTNLKNVQNFYLVNNLIVVDLGDGYFDLIDEKYQSRRITLPKKVKSIGFYQNHYIVLWENQGIGVYDNAFKPSNFLAKEVNNLKQIKTTTIFSGAQNILWVGTDGNGLIQISPKDNIFELVSKDQDISLSKPVRSFAEIGSDLWVGTKGNGILIFNNFFQNSKINPNAGKIDQSNGLENNSVYTIKNGQDQLTYIGSDGSGISIYDQLSKKVISWKNILGVDTLPNFKSVYSIDLNDDGSMWIGTSGYGLIHLKIVRAGINKYKVLKFKQYLSSSANGVGPVNDIIYALQKDKNGRLWIACRYGGLSVYDSKTKHFKTFRATGKPNDLSHNDVLSLYIDSSNRLWVGTSFGLSYMDIDVFDFDNPVFNKLTTENGLPNNTFHAIEEDAAGNIWLSTNKGLAKISKQDLTIINYDINNGLQSNEFSDGAILKTSNRLLFFGGIYGFNYLAANKSEQKKPLPNIMLSDLQFGTEHSLDNSYLILYPSITKENLFEIERENNFFQISINVLNYIKSSNNEFSYQLKGLDKNWRYSSSEQNISYYNIPPGDYEFLIRWNDEYGNQIKNYSAFKLVVKQYWWLTNTAFFIYLILLVALVLIYQNYRKRQLEMQFNLEKETMIRLKDKNIHKQRLNFFTNIAHEIHTPLALILGSIEHFMQKKNMLEKPVENNYFLNLLHQHTARLTYLVQQLLEFRRAEAGFLERHDNFIEISNFLNSLADLFDPIAKNNQQQFTRNIQPELAGFLDKDKYEKILFNLLYNAFKYADEGEEVSLDVELDLNDNNLITIVRNSGCKLNYKDLEGIFDQYHIGEEQHLDKFKTGIGLTFTKELVNVLGGEIKVELEDGWISFIAKVKLGSGASILEENVENSTPSYIFESVLKPNHQEVLRINFNENKSTIIDGIQSDLPKILVVEDDLALRILIKNILKDAYLIYEANDGQSALDILEKQIPDLIISDVMMEGMDGLTLCKKLKLTPATCHIPFILLSARNTEDQKAEGYETGADAYIPKPFHVEYLLMRIRKLLDYKKRMNKILKDRDVNEQFINVELNDSDKKFLNQLVALVEERISDSDLSATVLEQHLTISKMQLYRKLKALCGMTPSEFIKRIRLKHAAFLLQNTKLSVSEIFYQTGFNNKSYFFREFKKIYSLAPNEYRLKYYHISQDDILN